MPKARVRVHIIRSSSPHDPQITRVNLSTSAQFSENGWQAETLTNKHVKDGEPTIEEQGSNLGLFSLKDAGQHGNTPGIPGLWCSFHQVSPRSSSRGVPEVLDDHVPVRRRSSPMLDGPPPLPVSRPPCCLSRRRIRECIQSTSSSPLYPYVKARTTTQAVTGTATAQNRLWLCPVSLISVVFMPIKLDTKELEENQRISSP